MKYDYRLSFTGTISRIFKFTVEDTADPIARELGLEEEISTLSKYVYLKDGYLYIQGCRITNNPEGIRVIRQNLGYNKRRDVEVGCVDASFTIDESGYVICTNQYSGSNKVDRFIDRIMRHLS